MVITHVIQGGFRTLLNAAVTANVLLPFIYYISISNYFEIKLGCADPFMNDYISHLFS